MYQEFYGLVEKPFSLTPNPRYVFYADHYRQALDQLQYGVAEREGFTLLTGMVGTGKTTLSRELLESLGTDRYRTALVFNPFLSGTELLETLLSEFGCSYPAGGNRKDLLDRLNRYLLTQLVEGRTCVAIFDEAQHLPPEFLEQIRVLSNLETEQEKLLQIILVGQPELRERIRHASLAQLDQRVSLRCTLRNLTREETERYVQHRLNTAGAQGRIRLSPGALTRIHREAQGVPRLINLICDRSLLAAYVDRSFVIRRRHVARGLQSLRGEEIAGRPAALDRKPRWRYTVPAALAGLTGAVSAIALWFAGVMP
jgi:general secretion pathway protein A